MAEIKIVTTNFLPGRLSVKEVMGSILAEFQNVQSPKLKKLFERTIENWNEPPSFEVRFAYAGGEAKLWTVIMGTDKEIWKWIWLDEGTSVRHAILSDNWISKTQPRMLRSGKGQGRVVGINKEYLGAGIIPRDFAEQISEIMEDDFADDIQAAINRGLDRADAKRGKVVVY